MRPGSSAGVAAGALPCSAVAGSAGAPGSDVGGGVASLYSLYPEAAYAQVETLPDGATVEVRRYPELGIGFELRQAQVT